MSAATRPSCGQVRVGARHRTTGQTSVRRDTLNRKHDSLLRAQPAHALKIAIKEPLIESRQCVSVFTVIRLATFYFVISDNLDMIKMMCAMASG